MPGRPCLTVRTPSPPPRCRPRSPGAALRTVAGVAALREVDGCAARLGVAALWIGSVELIRGGRRNLDRPRLELWAGAPGHAAAGCSASRDGAPLERGLWPRLEEDLRAAVGGRLPEMTVHNSMGRTCSEAK